MANPHANSKISDNDRVRHDPVKILFDISRISESFHDISNGLTSNFGSALRTWYQKINSFFEEKG